MGWIRLRIEEYPDLPRPAQADWERLDAVLQGIGSSLPKCRFAFEICSGVVDKGKAVVLGDWYLTAPPKEPWNDDLPRFLPETVKKGAPKLRLAVHGDNAWELDKRLN